MEEEKNIVVYVDDVPKFNLILNKYQTIKSLKKYFQANYPNYTIDLYLNSNYKLQVFKTNKHDKNNFESVWNNIDNTSQIHLTKANVDLNLIKTTTQSVKVAHLRKKYGKDVDLRKWLENSNNIYVGRRGRIFIDGEIFHYPESQWANPYKVKDYSLDESLQLYRQHLKDEGLLDKLNELKGKCLGCFCDTASTTDIHKIDCHTKVLYEEIQKLNK